MDKPERFLHNVNIVRSFLSVDHRGYRETTARERTMSAPQSFTKTLHKLDGFSWRPRHETSKNDLAHSPIYVSHNLLFNKMVQNMISSDVDLVKENKIKTDDTEATVKP